MAVFTVSVKWNDEWFSNLRPLEKLVFLYLTDRCDNAGFFEINKRVDAFLIGISEDEFIGHLKTVRKCYVASKDGKKVWLKNFLKHQKNLPLNPDNNSHKQIITMIMLNIENFEYDFNILAPNKGLFSPIGKVIVNIGNSKGKVMVKEGGTGETEKPELWTTVVKNFHNDFIWKEKFCRDKNLTMEVLEKKMKDFISDLELREDFKTLPELKNHFTNTYNKNKINGDSKGFTRNGTQLRGNNVIESNKTFDGSL